MADDTRIKIQADGPYVVTGGVPLTARRPIESEHGEPLSWTTPETLDDGAAYALCRCGGSGNKPYCDGTHAGNGFDGTEQATTAPYADTASNLGGAQYQAVTFSAPLRKGKLMSMGLERSI